MYDSPAYPSPVTDKRPIRHPHHAVDCAAGKHSVLGDVVGIAAHADVAFDFVCPRWPVCREDGGETGVGDYGE